MTLEIYSKAGRLLGVLAMTAGLFMTVSDAQAQSTLEQAQERDTIKIGLAQEPPYTLFNPQGEPTGAAPDLVKAVMTKLGVAKVTGESSDWGALIPGLQARRFDIVSTGLIITPVRCKAVLFSEPDLCSAEGFAVRKGNPRGLESYQDLVANEVNVGICGGCVEEKRAIEVGVPRERLIVGSDILNVMKMLQAGRVDVVAWPDITLREAIRKLGDDSLEVVSPVKGEPISCSGVAFNKSDAAFRDAYDKAFAELKQSGEYAEIVESYGFDAELGLEATRADFCPSQD